MNKGKVILGVVVAMLAVASAAGVVNKILSYEGSAFASGGLGGSIAITCLAAVGSMMIFKSAKKKPESSEGNVSKEE